MLCVPIPLIAHSRLPLKRKLVLCGVFGPGVLDVLFAILNRYYNFVMPHDLVFLAWYNGEASTAIMIATVPFCWVLLRMLFALDSWAGSSGGKQVVAANGGPPTIGSGQRVALGGGGIIRCWRCHYYACCKSLRTRVFILLKLSMDIVCTRWTALRFPCTNNVQVLTQDNHEKVPARRPRPASAC